MVLLYIFFSFYLTPHPENGPKIYTQGDFINKKMPYHNQSSGSIVQQYSTRARCSSGGGEGDGARIGVVIRGRWVF